MQLTSTNTVDEENEQLTGSLGSDSTENQPLSNSHNKKHEKRISLARLLLATICFAGIQFGWALQISLLTPFILELGLPKPLVTIVWLCGPVAGLVVQPIVGSISDQCTSRLGRRRPFILSGAILVCLSLLLIPNSLDIGHVLGDTVDHRPVALAITVAGFWLLDIANNMLQGPCRALVADIAAADQQEIGNAIFSIWLGTGNITGFMAGWFPWSEYITFTETKSCKVACQNLRISFMISTVFLIVTTVLTMVAAKEIPYSKKSASLDSETGEPRQQKGNPVLHLFKVLFRLPQPMIRICLVQFFNWFGWFAFLIYITDWMAENIFHGKPGLNDPAHSLYEQGVRFGSFGLAGFALVSLLFSPFVPRISRGFGAKMTFFLGQLCLCLSLVLTVVVTNKYLGLVLIASFGIPWSITNTIPFALTANVAPKDEKGVYMGILNIFVVIPQLVMSGVGSLISYLFDGNVAASLATGGISVLISCFFVFLLIVPDNMHKSKGTKRRRKRSVPDEESIVVDDEIHDDALDNRNSTPV